MTTLTSRQQAALEQMGISPLTLRKPKVPLALIRPDAAPISQSQLVDDVLRLLDIQSGDCPQAVREQAVSAHRYWVMGQPRPGTATHLFSPALDKPLSVDEKRRLWRSLQRWL
ncbi:DNA polymerase III subunit psi [Marinobacter hydrocarbonoclasticus]|nr:DNA polymerase III subunit psi [Marinobacter nauticus]